MTVKHWKAATIIAFISVAGGVISSQRANSLFPFIPISIFICGIAFIPVIHYTNGNRDLIFPSIISIIISTGVLRWYIFKFPSSFIGFDPDKYAYWTRLVIDSGHTSNIPNSFYSAASEFMILPAIVSILGKMPVRSSFGVYPVLIGTLVPMLTICFAKEISPRSPYAMVSSAILGGVIVLSTRLGYWSVPQLLGALLFQTFLLGLIIHSRDNLKSSRLLLVTLLTSLVFAHKFPLFLLLLTVVIITMVHSIVIHNSNILTKVCYSDYVRIIGITISVVIILSWAALVSSFSPVQLVGIGLIIGISTTFLQYSNAKSSVTHLRNSSVDFYILTSVLAICLVIFQWLFVTEFFDSLFYNYVAPLLGPGLSIGFSDPVFTHATIIEPGAFLEIFFHRSNSLILLLLTALVCLWAFLSAPRQNLVHYSVVISIFILTPLSLTVKSSFGIGIQRIMINIEAFFAGIVGFGLANQYKEKRRYKTIASLILTIVVMINAFALIGVPDYSGQYRGYLNEDEVTGKSFTSKYTEGNITTDLYYSQENISLLKSGYGDSDTQFIGESDGFLNATLYKKGYEYVLLRPNIRVYRMNIPGTWVLQWEPEEEVNRTYSKIYNNGDVHLYRESNHQTDRIK